MNATCSIRPDIAPEPLVLSSLDALLGVVQVALGADAVVAFR